MCSLERSTGVPPLQFYHNASQIASTVRKSVNCDLASDVPSVLAFRHRGWSQNGSIVELARVQLDTREALHKMLNNASKLGFLATDSFAWST